MAIQIRRELTLFDKVLKRHSLTEVPMVQDIKLVDYNSIYLSLWICLDGKNLYSVLANGQVRRYESLGTSDWLEKYIPKFNQVESRPWIIVNGDTDLLSRLRLSGSLRRLLKGKEVAVFFYEPQFNRTPGERRVPSFYDRNTPVYFPELIWLEKFLENHKRDFSAVAYVCDYGLGDFLKSKSLHPELPVRTWDIFVADLLRSLVEREVDRDKNFREDGYPFNFQVSKKYICPNFRYEGIRELMVGYLWGSGFGPQGHTSFFHYHDRNHCIYDLPFEPTRLEKWELIESGLLSIQDKLPLTMDTKESLAFMPRKNVMPDFDGISNKRSGFEFHHWYDECFLAIVNETRFGMICGEISEKVLTPILYMRPFVVVGGPYVLRYLRELGFETFSDCWDESYDEIEDHRDRFAAILKLLDGILSKPLPELQELLKKLEARLARNRRHLVENLQNQMHEELRNESGKPLREKQI